MASLSDYAERKILDHLFKNTTYTSPNAYIALFTTDPTDSDSGTEVSGNGYARVQIDTLMGSAASASDVTSITNTSAITFAAASGGSFGTITHIGIYDASTAGNLIAAGQLTASKQIDDGDQFQINTGNLTITID